MTCTYRLVSPPPTGQAAISIVQITGDIDSGLSRLGIKPVPLHRAALREIPGVDTLVIARFSPAAALIFPHAGAAVMRRLVEAFKAAGFVASGEVAPMQQYPEAASLIEARMLGALARAESPLAIDLLLDQPRRWVLAERDPSLRLPDDACAMLNRLIDPPLVLAYGPPNIGKSSLLNALAGRAVSIVADQPGTTRDHVGVSLDLAGLVIRYIDTPGMRHTPGMRPCEPRGSLRDNLANSIPPSPDSPASQDPILTEAQHLAHAAAASADLILLCADAGTTFLPPPSAAPTLRVAIRADLGATREPSDLEVSVKTQQGIESLVQTIRERLVPQGFFADPRAWRFW